MLSDIPPFDFFLESLNLNQVSVLTPSFPRILFSVSLTLTGSHWGFLASCPILCICLPSFRRLSKALSALRPHQSSAKSPMFPISWPRCQNGNALLPSLPSFLIDHKPMCLPLPSTAAELMPGKGARGKCSRVDTIQDETVAEFNFQIE